MATVVASSAPLWPSTLPQKPLISNYKETVPSNLIRSDTDTGPAKVRRRGHAKPYAVEASYVLSTEQLSTLITFAEETLGGGAICFDWPRPVTLNNSGGNTYVRARMNPSNDGLFSYSTVSDSNEYWDVSLTLEIFPDVPLA